MSGVVAEPLLLKYATNFLHARDQVIGVANPTHSPDFHGTIVVACKIRLNVSKTLAGLQICQKVAENKNNPQEKID